MKAYTCPHCGGSWPDHASWMRHHCRPAAPAAQTPTTARDTQVAGDHYTKMAVQPWDVVDTWPLDQRIGYYRGGALKYLMRMGAKDASLQEVAKGRHYLEKLLEVLREVSNAR